MQSQDLDPRGFLDRFGKEEAERVAVAAGTNFEYFMQIVRGTRRPSVELADRLVEESRNRLSFVGLMRSKVAA